MKKSTFVALLFGTIGGLLFSLGLCMCLIPEWDLFRPGVVCTAAGAVVLVTLALVARIRSGKKIHIRWPLVGKILYGICAALVLGVGMCLVLVWGQFLPGIGVGIVGIVLLLFLIPMCLGWK